MVRSNVRRGLLLATLVLTLVLVPACIKQKVATKVKTDGSGTVAMAVTFNLEKIEQLKEMMGGMMGGSEGEGQDDPLKQADPEQIKKLLKGNEHVRVVSADTTKDDEKKTLTHTINIEFDSLQALYESGLIEGMDTKLEKLESGDYRWTTEMSMGGEGMGTPEEMEQQAQMMMAMFEPFLGDMEMSGSVTLPTAVVETNGTKGEAGDVSWVMTFKDLLKADKRKQTVTFKGDGIAWKPFEVKAADAKKKRAEILGTEEEETEEVEEVEEEEVEEPAPR